MTIDPTFIGYAAAAISFALLSAALMTVWRHRYDGTYLVVATLATSIWGAALAYSTDSANFSRTLVIVIELACDAAWLLFLSSLMAGGLMGARSWVARYAGVVLAVGLLFLGLLSEASTTVQSIGIRPGSVLVFGSILTSLFALISLEQIYRNARDNQFGELKHICLGLSGVFGIDLLLYSNAVFIGEVGATFWSARGFVVAMCAPLIALSVVRRRINSRGFFLSRQVVFYSATLVAAGLYLTFIGIVGYFVQNLNIAWVAVAKVTLAAGALLLFLMLAMSERLRARIRVYIVKHFFVSKYDYREEWLKLIDTLTATEGSLPLRKRTIQALAHIVGSQAGTLWLQSAESGAYVPVTAWNMRPAAARFGLDSEFVNFVKSSGWIIDVEELRRVPGQFGQSADSVADIELGGVRILVPLNHENHLIGIIGLSDPKKVQSLNFEDHDLLKTAGKQIAGYLVQESATERLAESRQFEAFNRMTAFVMHDLKNAIAQQSLIVKNAEKHRRNPDFVDDAIETIKGSVARIRKVVNQLQQGARDQHTDRVDIGKLILQAASESDDREPVPTVRLCNGRLFVLIDQDRLLMALCHAIRNAQDATAHDGRIEIELSAPGDTCVIRISDSGRGMNEEFVRERLFKPFDSTKGTQGMGIGAYQIRETIRSAGGSVLVESAPDAGTTLSLILPLAP